MKRTMALVSIMLIFVLNGLYSQAGFTDFFSATVGYDTVSGLNSDIDYLIGMDIPVTDLSIMANGRLNHIVNDNKAFSLGLQLDWYLANYFGLALGGGAYFPEMKFSDPVPYAKAQLFGHTFTVLKAGLDFTYRLDKNWGLGLYLSLPIFSWPAKMHKTHFNYLTTDKRLVGKWVYEDEKFLGYKSVYEFKSNHRVSFSVIKDDEVISTLQGTYSTFSDSTLVFYWYDTDEHEADYNYTIRTKERTLAITQFDPYVMMYEINPEFTKYLMKYQDFYDEVNELQGKASGKKKAEVYNYRLED